MTIKDISSSAHFQVNKAGAVATGSASGTTSILNWVLHKTPVGYWLRYIAFRAAVNRAYLRFADRYSDWVDSFFDKYFVQQKAKSLLARYLQPVDPPTPTELATLWEDQFPVDHLAHKYVADLTPVAADFLRLLETEMEGGFLLRKV
jgi:hypothetical protein